MAVLLHEKITDFFNNFWDTQGIDNAGENFGRFLTYPTVGIVVNVDDPLQMGRLQVFCPAYGDNPKKLLHLPWVAYASPFAGSIKNACYTRGVMDGPEHTTGAVHYGFWAIPEQGAHVIVSCLDADPRRRIYTACLPEHQETHTLLTGRYKWGEGGIPDGPLSSENSPIEPLYTNLGEAFQGDRESREWKTRGADYQPTAVREDVGEVPNDTKTTYLDQQYDKISEAEQDGWVKPILGSHGYDWTGLKGTGAFLSSRMYGWSTPGGHTFFMDDRPFNSRIKLRTATGHQVILDDTNERIYVSTNKGKCWIEMDTCGNIDFFSEGRISMNTEKGFNFSTDDTFRVHAKKGIHLYSGNNISQEDLESIPNDGEIRIQAEDDMHLITNETLRWYSYRDSLFEIGGKKCESIGDSYYLHVENDIHTITNYGSYFLTISADINEIVNGSVKRYALGNQAYAADGDFESFSFGGRMDIGSQRILNIKSIAEDITMETMGSNTSATGGVFIKTPLSQQGISNDGIFMATAKKIRGRSEEDTDFEVGETSVQDRPLPEADIGDCNIGGPIDTTGLSGADLAAAAAYNAGFRGDALVTATAIARGESSYNPSAVGDTSLTNSTWGPSHGLWQIRTLNNPENYGNYRGDNLRVGDGRLFNPNTNAEAAYAVSNNGTDFGPWSVYTSGDYLNYIDEATAAVNNMCGGSGPPMSMSFKEMFASGCPGQSIKSLIADFSSSNNITSRTALKLTTGNIDMQSKLDIRLKSITENFSTTVFNDIIPQINTNSDMINSLGFSTGSVMAAIVGTAFGPPGWLALIGAAASFVSSMAGFAAGFPNFPGLNFLSFLEDLGLEFDIDSVPNMDIPFFNSVSQEIFYYQNHDTIFC